jgi:hypothetical protein
MTSNAAPPAQILARLSRGLSGVIIGLSFLG